MGFSLIGRIEWAGPAGTGRPAGALQRRLLAILALEANRTVSERRLIEALWDDEPPRTARRTLHAHVSRLRRALAATGVDAVVLHRDGGYELAVDPDQVDVLAFEALAEMASKAMAADAIARGQSGSGMQGDDQAEAALAHLEAALRLSDGEPLAGCQGTTAFDAETARLRELRVSAAELRIEALQALGRHDQTIPELERLTAAYPLRERLWQLLMLALYAGGRQADALEAYARARAHLVKELGLEPGPELRRLQSAVLAQDPALIGASPNGRHGQPGLGELQSRKLEHMFRRIDADGDGVIGPDDFERHAGALAGLRGLRAGTPAAEAIRGPITGWWERISETIASDGAAGNGRCDLSVWLDFWSSWLAAIMANAAIGGGPALEQMKATTVSTFEALDADGDGHVSAAEYDAWLGSWGRRVQSRRSFMLMDEDGDGLLTKEQVVRLLKEFFLTNDPEAAGNHLFGPLFEQQRAD